VSEQRQQGDDEDEDEDVLEEQYDNSGNLKALTEGPAEILQ